MSTVFDTRAEARANNYRQLLEDAGWTVEVTKKTTEALRGADGEVWSAGRVSVLLTAKRQGDGHLVVSWVSTVDTKPGEEPTTRRLRALRRADYAGTVVELDTDTKFFNEFEDMIGA
jgi:branched-subunit amino acid aminotransferase/4-amino-4-deoxychorismate lyase